MLTTAASMVLEATHMAVDCMATPDTQPLTATDTAGSTSVRLKLSQRLMPTTAASMVLVPTDTTLDSMAIAHTLPPHTPPMATPDTQPLTATDTAGSTSVRLMLSQRLMPTTLD